MHVQNEYNVQAAKWLDKYDVRISIKRSDLQTPAPWAESEATGYKYDVALATSRGVYRFPFWDSVHNRQTGEKPTAYDVLACLSTWEGSLDDFVDEFGYRDVKASKAIETYNSVIDQSLQLKHILSAPALAALQEIS